MSLRRKLTNRSALIFAATLGFVLLGAYLLFRHYTRDLYYRKLEERARTAALFYLEKDELTGHKYREIEEKYRQISAAPIRLYYADDFRIYVPDGQDYSLSRPQLEAVMPHGVRMFQVGERQCTGIFYKDNQGDFIVVASGSNSAGSAQLAALRWMLLCFFGIGMVINYSMTRWLSHRTFRPFSRLIRKVNAITADNLHTRLEVPSQKPDELTALITTFNYLLERLEAGVRSQRNFLRNASHELKTPLAAMIGEMDVTLRQPRSNDDYRGQLQLLQQEARHLQAITEGLLALSGLELSPPPMHPVRIDEVLWNVLEKAAADYPGAEVHPDLDGVADQESLLTVHGNRELLFVALSNLVDNAIKFSRPAPVQVKVTAANGRLAITVSDRGPGITADEQARIFDLFYRSPATRHLAGHGIGLHLTLQILDRHGIEMAVSAAEGGGTVFRLLFPAPFSSFSNLA
ncbi:HAMP domain-containing sensor histidine kinase [Chitinophaga caseinilytica]|uniref:histidine kinase n=1 Tax=Chitinophaga caseinilytica TaxID=2267521 RepID=A0ABZ2Z4U8_9BACT